jgi:hypothetical protein
MFEINKYLLNKLGWINYSITRGISVSFLNGTDTLFEDDPLVRFFFTRGDNKLYVIKELSSSEKQNSKNLYKFIIVDLSPLEFNVIEFNSNMSLFKMIIENGACNNEYRRGFKINKILK